MNFFRPAAALLILFSFCATTLAQPTTAESRSLYERISPSLVVVQYTYDGEAGRHELAFTGVVVSDDGLIITSLLTTPVQLADAYLKDFKIIIPGEDQTELAADFLGRDERTNLSFFKCKDKHQWTPLKFEQGNPQVGDPLVSIGLLPKEAGYKQFLTAATVSAILRGPVPQVLTSGALGGIGAPVFDSTGRAIGIVLFGDRSSLVLNGRHDTPTNTDAGKAFVPTSDFMLGLNDPPTMQKPVKLPNIGVAGLSGLKKDVADYFGLKGQPAVQIGDVIPDFPAAKAGLKAGDVIVKVDGQPLERGDEPEETPLIMTRKILRMKVGQVVTVSVMRKKGEPLADIPVTLGERPIESNKAKRFYAEDLGFTARQLVFDDTYARRLSADAKGVIVALVRADGAARSAKLEQGDVVIKLNQSNVENVETFKSEYEAFRKQNPHEAVVLEVQRGAGTQSIRIEPPQ